MVGFGWAGTADLFWSGVRLPVNVAAWYFSPGISSATKCKNWLKRNANSQQWLGSSLRFDLYPAGLFGYPPAPAGSHAMARQYLTKVPSEEQVLSCHVGIAEITWINLAFVIFWTSNMEIFVGSVCTSYSSYFGRPTPNSLIVAVGSWSESKDYCEHGPEVTSWTNFWPSVRRCTKYYHDIVVISGCDFVTDQLELNLLSLCRRVFFIAVKYIRYKSRLFTFQAFHASYWTHYLLPGKEIIHRLQYAEYLCLGTIDIQRSNRYHARSRKAERTPQRWTAGCGICINLTVLSKTWFGWQGKVSRSPAGPGIRFCRKSGVGFQQQG